MAEPTKTTHYYDSGQIRYEAYCLNDKLHKTDGPAFISYYLNGQISYEVYYLNGRRVTEEQIQEIKFNQQFTKDLEEELQN